MHEVFMPYFYRRSEMKKLSLPLLALSFILLFASVPLVYASGAVSSSPANIAPDQTNTITINPGVPFVVAVAIIGPDGSFYASTSCTVNSPCAGDATHPVVLTFGTGVSGWIITSPPSQLVPPLSSNGVGSGCTGYTPSSGGAANTHCSGQYSYVLAGFTYNGQVTFAVGTTSFSVPEFGLPAFMMAAFGLVLITLRKGLLWKSPL